MSISVKSENGSCSKLYNVIVLIKIVICRYSIGYDIDYSVFKRC